MVIIFTDCNKLSVQEKAERYMMATPKGMGVNLRYMRSRQAAIAGASQTLNVYHIQRRFEKHAIPLSSANSISCASEYCFLSWSTDVGERFCCFCSAYLSQHDTYALFVTFNVQSFR